VFVGSEVERSSGSLFPAAGQDYVLRSKSSSQSSSVPTATCTPTYTTKHEHTAMETPTKLPYVTRATGVYAHLEGLGLQTLNDSSAGVKNRAIFTFQPVIRLYKLKIPALFGVLLRDEAILDRDDPKLFDDELETLLREFGPFVWSVPGEGSRDHLRTAQTGTLYVTDIIYPRDAAILKDRLRGLILSKRSNHGTDIQALIDKTHHVIMHPKLRVEWKLTQSRLY